MLQAALYYGDLVQVALVAVSFALVFVSVGAYRKRPEGRYLLLVLAFSLLCLVSAGTAVVELFAGAAPNADRFVEAYLVPSLELVMVVSFLVAALWSSRAKKPIAAALLAATIAVGLAGAALYVAPSQTPSAQVSLPSDCLRPDGGFLIVASNLGYNDSISHGAPVKSWPILDVAEGAPVDITVCNTYATAVGFQVTHYLSRSIDVIEPGQASTFTFLANQTGTFNIYCAVFSPIHLYLQGGLLDVS